MMIIIFFPYGCEEDQEFCQISHKKKKKSFLQKEVLLGLCFKTTKNFLAFNWQTVIFIYSR